MFRKLVMKKKNQQPSQSPLQPAPRKRGRPSKTPATESPKATEPRKRGRPSKTQMVEPTKAQVSEPLKKPRGRPRKVQAEEPVVEVPRTVEPQRAPRQEQMRGVTTYKSESTARPRTRKSAQGAQIVYVNGYAGEWEYVQDYYCGRQYIEVLLRPYGGSLDVNLVHVALSDIFTRHS